MTPLQLAQLCQQSYEGGPQFTDVEELCFGVIDCGDSVVVVFRGSANLSNWLLDMEAFPQLTKSGCMAHHGFVTAMDELWDTVRDQLPGDDRTVIYTGHSLGGALAVLFAQQTGAQAVTFGCPRVWWSKDEPPTIDHVRVVCDDDPVPLVPRVSFQHDKTEAIVMLVDGDCEFINPCDHFIDHYVARLEKETA
jgi:predicted lipase